MVSPKKLLQVAKNWQRLSAMKKKRISFFISRSIDSSDSLNASFSGKGRFVIYTIDHTRFSVPICYLSSDIFRKLLDMSEEMFGLPSAGPITFPCNAIFKGYILTLMEKDNMGKDIENSLLAILDSSCRTLSVAFHQGYTSQQPLVWAH